VHARFNQVDDIMSTCFYTILLVRTDLLHAQPTNQHMIPPKSYPCVQEMFFRDWQHHMFPIDDTLKQSRHKYMYLVNFVLFWNIRHIARWTRTGWFSLGFKCRIQEHWSKLKFLYIILFYKIDISHRKLKWWWLTASN